MNDSNTAEANETRTGMIIYFNDERSFGVIGENGTRIKYFFHKDAVRFPADCLRAGVFVRFKSYLRYDNKRKCVRTAASPVWLAEDLPEQDPDDGHTNYFEEAEKVERAERGRKGKW